MWGDGDRWGWGRGCKDWTTDGDGWRSGLQSASVRGGGEQTLRWKAAVRQSSVQVEEGKAWARSALSAPGAPMFAPAWTQQSLQRHLHKSLEVIASLPSAVLRGDQTQTDSFTGDTADHFTSTNPFLKTCLSPAQIGRLFQISPGSTKRVHVNAYLLASCCHLLSDHLSSAAL